MMNPEMILKLFSEKLPWSGSISNPDAREYGIGVYLCEEPAGSFNDFWKARLKELEDYQ